MFVDCDWGKKNTDLSGKYGVRGYPTVIFTDSKGTVLEELGSREPDGVLAQIEKIATKSAPAGFKTFDEGAAAAKSGKKLVIYLFTANNKDSAATEDALFDASLDKIREGFVVVKAVHKRDDPEAKRFGVAATDPPILLVLDPNAEKPEAAPLKRITGRKSAKDLLTELKSVPKPKGV